MMQEAAQQDNPLLTIVAAQCDSLTGEMSNYTTQTPAAVHGNVCLKARYMKMVLLVKEMALSKAITVGPERNHNPHTHPGGVKHIFKHIEVTLSVLGRCENNCRKASSMIATTCAFGLISLDSPHALWGQEVDEDLITE